MVTLVPVQTGDAIKALADIAKIIWNEYFPAIIGQAQVDYMITTFQSTDAINTQLTEGYDYFFILEGDKKIGYIGIVPRPEKQAVQISKFYLLKSWRGKGYARTIVGMIAEFAVERKFNRLYLTVNKYNDLALNAYQKIGFIKTGELEMDIGNGFVMDDYEMELSIP